MILGGFYNLKDRNCYIYISVIYLIAKIFFYNKIQKNSFEGVIRRWKASY